ncbi:U3 small nucleolar RNA-associated protein 25 [Carpediemonas membranifera]|uniref:U3 small nucleolar RNA-associated protein 25 n=1 Tax=Carpediemonas membranifera TaxID=201153 RepID=A0A8J6DYV7_9EUKA|nr:U3 small nucleolar RNA-associated protein 25 [Carpediemonas membranifera]|eukprot:KAG9389621.1 U3 small nucleolar RNA-associated protein 25 [Carpediemonas membranifera]
MGEISEILGAGQDLAIVTGETDYITVSERSRDEIAARICSYTTECKLRIAANNEKIRNATEDEDIIVDEAYKDQGYTKGRILYIAPTMSIAVALCERIEDIIASPNADRSSWEGRELFQTVFGPPLASVDLDGKELTTREYDGLAVTPYTDDGVERNNDFFLVGLTLKKDRVLYRAAAVQETASEKPDYKVMATDMVKADVIVGSPLALQLMVTGSTHYPLSSVEMVAIDSAHIIYYQNWEHMAKVMASLNQQPPDGAVSSGAKYSRVRPAFLDGEGATIRQGVVVTRFMFPDLIALQTRHRESARPLETVAADDKAIVYNDVRGLYKAQKLLKLSCPEFSAEALAGVKIAALPEILDKDLRTILVCPNYFNFTAVKAFLEGSEKYAADYVAISEYTAQRKRRDRRARFNGSPTVGPSARIALYSERAHFYKPCVLKKADVVVFVGPPETPAHYVEILRANAAGMPAGEALSMILFTKYDSRALTRIVGRARARAKLQGASEKRARTE